MYQSENKTMLKKYLNKLEPAIYYVVGLPEMTSAMITLLTGAGVSRDNIRAEEFTGFNLNKMAIPNDRKPKSHAALLLIALAIAAVVIVHSVAIFTLVKSGLAISLFKNPLFYLMLGLMLIIMIILKRMMVLRHGEKKGWFNKWIIYSTK